MRGSCLYKIKRNTRGASMLIALLVFLIAALSGTVALTMASSNAGRYTHERQDQQPYLSVVSAAKLIVNRLEGLTVQFKSKTTNAAPISGEEVDIFYKNCENEDLFLADRSFKDILKAYSVNSGSEKITMEFYLSSESAAEMGEVCVSLTRLGSNFNFRLYAVDGQTRDYQMTVKMTSTYSGTGVNNFQQDSDGYYYRNLTFETSGTSYEAESGVAAAEPAGGKI